MTFCNSSSVLNVKPRDALNISGLVVNLTFARTCRVATSCSQKNGTVQGPKARSLRPEGPKNEAKGRGGVRFLGRGQPASGSRVKI